MAPINGFVKLGAPRRPAQCRLGSRSAYQIGPNRLNYRSPTGGGKGYAPGRLCAGSASAGHRSARKGLSSSWAEGSRRSHLGSYLQSVRPISAIGPDEVGISRTGELGKSPGCRPLETYPNLWRLPTGAACRLGMPFRIAVPAAMPATTSPVVVVIIAITRAR